MCVRKIKESKNVETFKIVQMKKIGILTYNRALNFGANLQACSTYCYLQKHGYAPIFISYTPADAVNENQACPSEQVVVQREFQHQFASTAPCHNAKEVADVLKTEGIRNVIIGSDAVAQHHPFLSRVVFPSRRFLTVIHPSSDKMFPNPFWGDFLDFTKDDVCVSLMSVSNQQSDYKRFSSRERREMMRYLERFKYISVRDDWTQSMYKYISKGGIIPVITPDPVFGFNENVDFVPSREELSKKFHLPDKYILLALRKGRSTSAEWVSAFETICEKNGFECIGLPFPYGFVPNNVTKKKFQLPMTPIEWYSLIKYSNGYVGHNMHTIVSALHNAVPCFSFDQYGRRILSQFVVNRSSKIYHILKRAGFEDYRSVSVTVFDRTPTPQSVFDKLMLFDTEKCKKFAAGYYQEYLKMMESIQSKFIENE